MKKFGIVAAIVIGMATSAFGVTGTVTGVIVTSTGVQVTLLKKGTSTFYTRYVNGDAETVKKIMATALTQMTTGYETSMTLSSGKWINISATNK